MHKYKLETTDKFEHTFEKLDAQQKLYITKAIDKILNDPLRGKRIQYKFKGSRSLRIGPFRLIYEIKGNIVQILMLDHRKRVYKR